MTAPIPRDIPDLPALPGVPALLPSHVPATAVVTPVRHPLTAVYRLLVALMAAAGVTIDLLLGSPVRVLSYFTIQSNILLALVFVLSARRAWSARRPLPSALTGATLLYIFITGPGVPPAPGRRLKPVLHDEQRGTPGRLAVRSPTRSCTRRSRSRHCWTGCS